MVPRTALAKIESLRATGGESADIPIQFVLSVDPDDAPTHRVEMTADINLVDVPDYRPGGTVVVEYPPDRPWRVRLVQQPTPEWRSHAESARIDRARVHIGQTAPRGLRVENAPMTTSPQQHWERAERLDSRPDDGCRARPDRRTAAGRGALSGRRGGRRVRPVARRPPVRAEVAAGQSARRPAVGATGGVRGAAQSGVSLPVHRTGAPGGRRSGAGPGASAGRTTGVAGPPRSGSGSRSQRVAVRAVGRARGHPVDAPVSARRRPRLLPSRAAASAQPTQRRP